jgi:polyferredoxin
MLRKIRIILASIFFVGVTLLFLDFTGGIHAWLGWMAKVQLLPAVLAMNFGVVAVLLVLTLLFGRIYCSVVCPLGVMQDIISWIHGKTKKKNTFRFKYSPAKKWLRYLLLGVFVPVLALGANAVALLIAPYSTFGRIATNLFAPIYRLCNNGLAWIAERVDSYMFYSTEVWVGSISSLAIAAVTFVIIFILAWKNGRTWCNTICPVGTLLGVLSRFSLLAPVIDKEKCRKCGLCEKQCKASCINSTEEEIDYSRCVACMNCIDSCKEGAVKFGIRRRFFASAQNDKENQNDKGRRAFITSGALLVGAAAKAQVESKVDGGLAEVSYATKPERKLPVVPAGSVSLRNFESHCVACQLCINACPNNVLRPSSSLNNFMQPEMNFDKGYCRPECNTCSEVCPAGAIRPISIPEKTSIQIGVAVINLDNCIINTDNAKCGHCARICPSKAITMVRKNPDDDKSVRIPAVNEQKCIGCGACEHLCPARPFTAIHIEGIEVHKTR